jgi:hypothetical protein
MQSLMPQSGARGGEGGCQRAGMCSASGEWPPDWRMPRPVGALPTVSRPSAGEDEQRSGVGCSSQMAWYSGGERRDG